MVETDRHRHVGLQPPLPKECERWGGWRLSCKEGRAFPPSSPHRVSPEQRLLGQIGLGGMLLNQRVNVFLQCRTYQGPHGLPCPVCTLQGNTAHTRSHTCLLAELCIDVARLSARKAQLSGPGAEGYGEGGGDLQVVSIWGTELHRPCWACVSVEPALQTPSHGMRVSEAGPQTTPGGGKS